MCGSRKAASGGPSLSAGKEKQKAATVSRRWTHDQGFHPCTPFWFSPRFAGTSPKSKEWILSREPSVPYTPVSIVFSRRLCDQRNGFFPHRDRGIGDRRSLIQNPFLANRGRLRWPPFGVQGVSPGRAPRFESSGVFLPLFPRGKSGAAVRRPLEGAATPKASSNPRRGKVTPPSRNKIRFYILHKNTSQI